MRLGRIDSAGRGTRLYYRGVGLSAVGVLLFLIAVLQLSGLADLGAGKAVMAALAIGGAGCVMCGFSMMTAACCGPELDDPASAGPHSEPAAAEQTIAVRVRCRSCRALNDEAAIACKQCGDAL
jgi:hypothetical protein